MFEHRFTYLAGVKRNSHRFADQTALTDTASGRSWTYAELWADAGRLAAALAQADVRAGEVIVFALFNGAEFVLTWLAAQRLGAIAAPINFRLSAGEIAHVLDDSQPIMFIYDQALELVAADAITRAEHQPRLLVAAGIDTAPALSFDAFLNSGAAGADPPLPGPQGDEPEIYDETTRLYTSGTTGMPKGVSLCSMVEVLSAHDVIMHFPLSPQDRTLNMTPWFHRGGLYSGGPNPVLYVGAEAVALRQFDPAVVLDAVAERGLTFLIGAPTNLALLTAEQLERPRDLSSLNGIVTMGAPLDREACLRYQEVLTPRIFNGYGTTEAFWNTFLRPSDLPEHAGSAGRACTDDDVAVVKIYEDRQAELRRPRGARRRRGGRGHRPLGQSRLRLRQPARRAGAAIPRRVAVHRRPRHLGRRRVRHDRRPQGRHDHLRRRERAPDPGRSRALRASGGDRLGGRRAPGRALGRARRRLRRQLRSGAGRGHARGPLPWPPDARVVQAAAGLPVHRRTADDRDRQEAPLSDARDGGSRCRRRAACSAREP